MKKIATIAFLALIVFACSRQTVTTSTKPQEVPASESKAEVEVALMDSKLMSDVPVKTNPSTTAPTETVAAGKAIYDVRCGTCHELNPAEKYTAQRWDGILKSMIPKARLNSTEAAQVTAYVHAHAKK